MASSTKLVDTDHHHHHQRHYPETEESDPDSRMEIVIRRVGMEDHINIVKLFQTFDHEKYKFIQLPEAEQQQQQQHKQHNNNNNNNSSRNSRSMNKTSLSLAGLRIDERGGIYLNPLLDSNSAYFKCYVAEELNSGELIGYILFFNTLDDRGSMNGSSSAGGGTAAAGHDDPVAVIEDLFVKPKYRSRGIATQLWRKVLKSSLDRGCFSCECLLIPESLEGLHFWRHRVGQSKVEQLLQEHQRGQQELFIELSKIEMRTFFDQTALPDGET